MHETEEEKHRKEARQRKNKAAEFLEAAGSMEDLFMLFASLQPQISLMAKVLHMSGGDWHAREMRRLLHTGSRTYPLDELCRDGGCLDTMMKECLTSLLNPNKFRHVQNTERNATNILTTTLRLAATIFQVAYIPLRRMPFQLFEILLSEDRADACAALPICCRDAFSNAFLQRYPDAQSLKSAESKAVLSCLKEQMDMNTYSTERLHSQSLRRQKSRGQSCVASLSQLAAWRQGKASWRWCAKLNETKNLDGNASVAPSVLRPGGADEADDESGPPAPLPAKRQKIVRGGGSYRAWVHHCGLQGRLKGHQRFPSWLKEEYETMTEEERGYYTNLGSLATRSKRTSGMGFPKLPRHQQSASQASTSASTHGEAVDAASVAASSSSDTFLATATSCAGASQPTEPFDTNDLTVMFKNAAKEMKQTTMSANRLSVEDVRANTTALSSANADRLPTMREHLPFLGEGSGVKPIFWPHTSPAVALHFDVKTLFEGKHEQVEHSSIRDLAQQWESRHIGITARRYRAAGRAHRRKHCEEAGYCMCTGHGRSCLKLFLAMQNLLKPWLGEESVKTKVDAGLILLQFTSVAAGLLEHC